MYRRGPGLLGTMARTAVIAGTATTVSGGIMRHQANKAEEQQLEMQQQMQQQQPQVQQMQQMQTSQATSAVTGGLSEDSISKLQQLATLHSQGILTDAEFAAQKAAILGS
ncbi:MAG: SHOCT domain-containing protein [Chloroflexota bacterium]